MQYRARQFKGFEAFLLFINWSLDVSHDCASYIKKQITGARIFALHSYSYSYYIIKLILELSNELKFPCKLAWVCNKAWGIEI